MYVRQVVCGRYRTLVPGRNIQSLLAPESLPAGRYKRFTFLNDPSICWTQARTSFYVDSRFFPSSFLYRKLRPLSDLTVAKSGEPPRSAGWR